MNLYRVYKGIHSIVNETANNVDSESSTEEHDQIRKANRATLVKLQKLQFKAFLVFGHMISIREFVQAAENWRQ